MIAPEESSAHRGATDDALVDLARSGDASAYGELWRRHSGIGTAIARRYYEIADADDIVSESFARILSTLQRGGGPRSGFRPYLITTIGNVARRWATRSREGASDELDYLEDPKTIDDPVVASADRELALEAFRSLPDRWQAVLWYSAVEGMGPTDVAGYLGMTPNAAAVLAHRARAGLRTAWIQAHLNDASLSDECRWTAGRLGRRATGSLSPRELERVRLHLGECAACSARANELDHLSAKLAVLLVPALLGLGLTNLDSDDAAVAAAILPETAAPALAPTHLWLAGVAVAVVTATALVTSSLPPAAGETTFPAPTSSGSSDVALDWVLPESSLPTESVDPAPAEVDSSGSTAAPAPPPSTPAAPAVVAPAAPVVFGAIDPDALRPPTLAGSAAPGALVVVTDELGAEVARTTSQLDGSWSTGELTTLSAAASMVNVRQVGATGLSSPATSFGLAPRPLITGPTDGFQSPGLSPFDITVEGWPGARLEASFEAVEWLGYTEAETYPTAQLVLDAQGRGVLHIDGSVFWQHHVTFRYVDGLRQSPSVAGLTFTLTGWPD